jgi:hypothetical protein
MRSAPGAVKNLSVRVALRIPILEQIGLCGITKVQIENLWRRIADRTAVVSPAVDCYAQARAIAEVVARS